MSKEKVEEEGECEDGVEVSLVIKYSVADPFRDIMDPNPALDPT